MTSCQGTDTVADNAHAFAELDAHLDRLRRLGDVCKVAAPGVRDALEAKVQSNIAANVDPYGHAWFPSRLGKVLVNAAKAVALRVRGTAIEFEVTGVEALHHVGSARGYHGGSAKLGGFRRQLIPFKGIPGPMKSEIGRVLMAKASAIMGGK